MRWRFSDCFCHDHISLATSFISYTNVHMCMWSVASVLQYSFYFQFTNWTYTYCWQRSIEPSPGAIHWTDSTNFSHMSLLNCWSNIENCFHSVRLSSVNKSSILSRYHDSWLMISTDFETGIIFFYQMGIFIIIPDINKILTI